MDNASAKLGEKLLQGWAMLGETCMTCSAPLMRSRDGARTLCVVCPEKKMESTAATIDKSTAINNKSSKVINNDSLNGVELVLNCLNSLQRTIDCSALNVNDFCSLLETALVPLKCLENAFKDTRCSDARQLIYSRITERLSILLPQSDPLQHHLDLASIFNVMARLLQLRQEFNDVISTI